MIDTAEIIYEKPYSGEFTEVSFGSDRENTLWVKFSDRDGIEEWIGKFGCGPKQVMRVAPAHSPDTFFINAGGFAYLLNATHRRLLNHYFDPFIEDIVFDPETGHFIAAATDIRIIQNGEPIWTSHRIALDGISDLKIAGRTLTGLAIVGYDEETESFVLNLKTRKFIKASIRFAGW